MSEIDEWLNHHDLSPPIKNPKDWFKPAMADAQLVNYRWHDNRQRSVL